MVRFGAEGLEEGTSLPPTSRRCVPVEAWLMHHPGFGDASPFDPVIADGGDHHRVTGRETHAQQGQAGVYVIAYLFDVVNAHLGTGRVAGGITHRSSVTGRCLVSRALACVTNKRFRQQFLKSVGSLTEPDEVPQPQN